MACQYYREPKVGELIGCCNDGLAKIPSKTHENCMCRSETAVYANFCPIYARFKKKELNGHRGGILKRIILNGYRRHGHDSEIPPESAIAEKIHEKESVG